MHSLRILTMVILPWSFGSVKLFAPDNSTFVVVAATGSDSAVYLESRPLGDRDERALGGPMRRSMNTLRLLAAVALVSALGSCALFVGRTPEADNQASDAPPVVNEPVDDSADQPADQPDNDNDGSDTVAIVPGDTTEPPTASQPIGRGWRILDAGTNSAVRIPVARAVHDAAVWTEVWAAIHANRVDPPALPNVDFRSESVIVLLLGERRTGGYAVGIDGVAPIGGARSPQTVEVTVSVSAPGPGDMVTQALTSPYELSAIPIASAQVTFVGDDVEVGFEHD